MAADPRPANDSAPIRPSLFDRAVDAARRERVPTPAPAPRKPRPAIDRASLLLVIAILATPLLTWGGAAFLTIRARDEGAEIARRAAPQIARQAEAQRAHVLLQQIWRLPTLGTTVEETARALPKDAALLWVERDGAGNLSMEVVAPDPDRVIAALPGLRATAQARAEGDGRMRITLEQRR